eukprot:759676-Hanusia_phi.AAC.1
MAADVAAADGRHVTEEEKCMDMPVDVCLSQCYGLSPPTVMDQFGRSYRTSRVTLTTVSLCGLLRVSDPACHDTTVVQEKLT